MEGRRGNLEVQGTEGGGLVVAQSKELGWLSRDRAGGQSWPYPPQREQHNEHRGLLFWITSC